MKKKPLNQTEKKESTWATYLRLLVYVKPYRWRLFWGFICGILFGGATIGSLPVLQRSLNRFFDTSVPISLKTVLLISSAFIFLVVVRGLGSFASAYLIQWVGNRVVMDLRVRAFSHLQDLSIGYYNSSKTGEMISRTTNDTTLIEHAVATVITDLARQPIMFIGGISYAFCLDWKLAFCSLVVFPFCLIPIILFGRRVRKASKQGQERLADIVSIMQETIGGVRIVKAFNREKYEEKRFAAECKAFFSRIMKMVRAKAIIEPIIIFISVISFVATLTYASITGMSFDQYLVFGLALVILYDPVKRLSKIHLIIQRSTAAADRVFEILDTPCLVSDKPGAEDLNKNLVNIDFNNVSFTYTEEPVLQDINLSVKKGERIALVGGSGSGKTTLVSLLPRFFDVCDGSIEIGGKDIRDITLSSLRGVMGLVTQETFLFNDTVANNILYGKPDASMDEVKDAARRAHAHDFISTMDDGYNTFVGERGVRLSGGQRQRLSIARAILRNPPILILDEATSALDTESERMVQAALDELMLGRTVFAIAHRLSTVVKSDRIIVLDKGHIVEKGTHEDLLAKNGVYKRLYDMQFEL